MHWKKISSQILLQHPRLTVAEDEIELPDGHRSKYLRFEDTSDCAMVIATHENNILIQTEYSYPPDRSMHQLPGGAIEAGESPTEAALRELSEESGYVINEKSTVTYIGYFFINNRRSANKMHVIHVSNPIETGVTNFDPEEYIESQWISFDTLRTMIADGKIVNYTLLSCLSLFDNRKK